MRANSSKMILARGLLCCPRIVMWFALARRSTGRVGAYDARSGIDLSLPAARRWLGGAMKIRDARAAALSAFRACP
jgi:hypothetical protein